MFFKQLSLQNFRNYSKAEFNFTKEKTLVVGPNTAGKTNLIEAIFFLSSGKSFRGVDADVILFGEDVGRIKTEGLEIVFAKRENIALKRYFVNGVAKQRINFVGRMPCVLFTPTDLELVTAGPSNRRNYLDFVLEQVDSVYRRSTLSYGKALRSRNRLLENAKKLGGKNQKLFDYWDDLLIANGEIITKTRENFIGFINNFKKDVFDCYVVYEKSTISRERLLQYEDTELALGATLVGPHRDDFGIDIFVGKNGSARNIKMFGSRGQQRLAVLQLKTIELKYLEQKLGEKPLLLLDDIFSELDEEHIKLVLEMTRLRSTIITTAHKELLKKGQLKDMNVIELPKSE